MKDFTLRFEKSLLVIPHIASVRIDDIGRVIVSFAQGSTQEIGAGDQAPELLELITTKVNEYWQAQTPTSDEELPAEDAEHDSGEMHLDLGNMQINY